MEFFDTHCHLNHEQYLHEERSVIDRAREAHVSRLLCVGFDEPSSRVAVSLARANEGVIAAIGVHPESAGEWNPEIEAALAGLAWSEPDKVRAWGEIGLDYHWLTVGREVQRSVFAAQIACAERARPGIPLIIHCRDAQEDVLGVLDEAGTRSCVIMHCFTGDPLAAAACLDRGYMLGIGGVATFKKSDSLRDAIRYAPLERLVIETDCPFLAPQSRRGRRNEPAYLPEVAQTVAAVRGIPIEEVAEATTANALRLFWPEKAEQ